MSLYASTIVRWMYRRLSCADRLRISEHQTRWLSTRTAACSVPSPLLVGDHLSPPRRYRSTIALEAIKNGLVSDPTSINDVTLSQTAATHGPKLTGILKSHPAFANRLVRLPLNPDYHDETAEFKRLPKLLLQSFSEIWYSSAGSRWAENRKRCEKYMQNADHLWKVTERRSLTNWLDNIHDLFGRARAVADLLAGSALISLRRTLAVLRELKRIDNDFEVRASCLLIAGVLYKKALLRETELMQSFDDEIDKLRDPQCWPQHCPPASLLRPIFWRSDIQQTMVLVECLRTRYSEFSGRVAVVIATYCLRKGLHEEAFSFLQELSPQQFKKVESECLECCLALLRYDTVIETETGSSFRYLTALLDKGLTPDARLYNEIIQTAINLGHETVAWDVFDYARSIDTKIDHKACLALVRIGFLTGNFGKLDLVMTYIYDHPDLYRNNGIVVYAMNIVRRINHMQAGMTPAEGLSHILALYDRVYVRAPLAKFGFVQNRSSSSSKLEKAEPENYALAFTVWAYILCHKHGQSIDLLWRRIIRLVDAGDETVTNAMKLDLIYNAVIYVNIRKESTIAKALEVFRYMLDKGLCLPTSRTWTMLICGFLSHGKKDRAAQLYQMMQEHGFTTDDMRSELVPLKVRLDDLFIHNESMLDRNAMLADTTLSLIQPFAVKEEIQPKRKPLDDFDPISNEAFHNDYFPAKTDVASQSNDHPKPLSTSSQYLTSLDEYEAGEQSIAAGVL